LASSSWDKTVRLWDVFESKGAVETFQHSHDVLTLAYRPDGKQIACRLASVILDCIRYTVHKLLCLYIFEISLDTV
jgi:WD40 repeat protein